jgi:uncharacterized membrane protein
LLQGDFQRTIPSRDCSGISTIETGEGMDRSTYTKHRIFAAVLLLIFLVIAASYYLDLGIFGRYDKGVLILIMGIVVVYGCFFAPTRQDMDRHRRRAPGER